MNKKGFTLAEILGVIVIVSLLSIIIIPNIINSINNQRGNISSAQTKMLKEATVLFLDNNKEKYPNTAGNRYCITIENLRDGGYLSNDFFNVITKENFDKKIEVTIGVYGKRNIEIVNKCTSTTTNILE